MNLQDIETLVSRLKRIEFVKPSDFVTGPLMCGEAADALEHLLQRANELEAAQQWQPIETAPNKRVLVLSGKNKEVYVAERMWPVDGGDSAFCYARLRCNDGSLDCCLVEDPQFWQPLPKPPSSSPDTDREDGSLTL